MLGQDWVLPSTKHQSHHPCFYLHFICTQPQYSQRKEKCRWKRLKAWCLRPARPEDTKEELAGRVPWKKDWPAAGKGWGRLWKKLAAGQNPSLGQLSHHRHLSFNRRLMEELSRSLRNRSFFIYISFKGTWAISWRPLPHYVHIWLILLGAFF